MQSLYYLTCDFQDSLANREPRKTSEATAPKSVDQAVEAPLDHRAHAFREFNEIRGPDFPCEILTSMT
jgi:hypothetical protein